MIEARMIPPGSQDVVIYAGCRCAILRSVNRHKVTTGATLKASTRAALISALFFPGLGHLALRPRRTLRGMLFLAPAAAGVLYLLSTVLQLANQLTDELNAGKLALDPVAILERVHASGVDNPATNIASALMLLCWVSAVVDVLWLGRDQQSLSGS
jgi:hypothetical protein